MSDGQDVRDSVPLTAEQRNARIGRMKAWANLPEHKRAALRALLEDAHQQRGRR